MYGKPHDTFELKNCKLPYWRIGKGPDLVFIHGVPMDSRTWRHCVELLSNQYTCHLIDLPGTSFSEWNEDIKVGVNELSSLVINAIEKMNLTRFGLIGQDSGGSFARIAAAHFGDKVFGLALGNTEIPRKYTMEFKLFFILSSYAPLRAALGWAMQGASSQDLLFKKGFESNTKAKEFSELYLRRFTTSKKEHDLVMKFGKDIKTKDFDILEEAHSKIIAPVKFIWGKEDPFFPLKHCEQMLNQFKGEVSIKAVENSRLFIHEEQPVIFAEEVRSHFQNILDNK